MSIRSHDKGEKDLFEQAHAKDKKIKKKTISFLSRAKNNITISYENIIFFVIGFVMFCIIAFSLGVEKGRQDVNRIGYKKKLKIIKLEEKRGNDKNIILAKEKIMPARYIIQLASFVKKESAEQEKAKLKRAGYGAGIKKSGSYYQLYIGGLGNRKEAETLSEKLRERYNDCYIRKI